MATPQLPANTVYTAAETGNSEELKQIITGADFNIEELNKWDATSGLTPLMIASEKGHLECVKLLFSHPNIDINKGNSNHQFTALYCASIYGNIDVVLLLCSNPDITDSIINRKFYRNFHLKNTPYTDACAEYKGNDKVDRENKIKDILFYTEYKRYTKNIDECYKYRDKSHTKADIDANDKITFKNPNSWGYMVKNDRKEVIQNIFKAAQTGNIETLKQLVNTWFANDVLIEFTNFNDGIHYTPLSIASRYRHLECVKILLSSGTVEANISRSNGHFYPSPLNVASYYGFVEIVELLCSFPRINIDDEDSSKAANSNSIFITRERQTAAAEEIKCLISAKLWYNEYRPEFEKRYHPQSPTKKGGIKRKTSKLLKGNKRKGKRSNKKRASNRGNSIKSRSI